jgi:protein involved in ribonucleotide reduction
MGKVIGKHSFQGKAPAAAARAEMAVGVMAVPEKPFPVIEHNRHQIKAAVGSGNDTFGA